MAWQSGLIKNWRRDCIPTCLPVPFWNSVVPWKACSLTAWKPGYISDLETVCPWKPVCKSPDLSTLMFACCFCTSASEINPIDFIGPSSESYFVVHLSVTVTPGSPHYSTSVHEAFSNFFTLVFWIMFLFFLPKTQSKSLPLPNSACVNVSLLLVDYSLREGDIDEWGVWINGLWKSTTSFLFAQWGGFLKPL